MPPPDFRIRLDGVDVPGVRDIVVPTTWSDESLRDTILRVATGRPCTRTVMASICAALERRLRTRVTLSYENDAGPIVRGIGTGPIGYVTGREYIEIRLDLATYDQLNEIDAALREIVPVGIEVHVTASDGRTATRSTLREFADLIGRHLDRERSPKPEPSKPGRVWWDYVLADDDEDAA